jgi:TPR repeat protein
MNFAKSSTRSYSINQKKTLARYIYALLGVYMPNTAKTFFSIALFTYFLAFIVTGMASASTIEDANSAYHSKNYTEAFKLYRVLAHSGNREAEFSLGGMYNQGKGVPENTVLGFKWIDRSAKSGYPKAEAAVGALYWSGAGVVRDYAKAFPFVLNAAQNNVFLGQFILSIMYFRGENVSINYIKSYAWMDIAESNTIDLDQYIQCHNFLIKLSHIMSKQQISQAQSVAYNLVHDKYKSNNNISQTNLDVRECREANMSLNGTKPVTFSDQIRLLRLSAKTGLVGAINDLGIAYSEDSVLPNHRILSHNEFKKAADAGNKYAEDNLAQTFYFGYGTNKNISKALYWWRKASAAGESGAKYALGFLYYYGIGVPKNKNRAFFWFRKVRGDPSADAYLHNRPYWKFPTGSNGVEFFSTRCLDPINR